MKRYKVINAKMATLLSLSAMVLTLFLVFSIGHRSILIELEITTGVLAVVLFTFLSFGLYRGVRLQNDPLYKEGWKPFGKWDVLDFASAGDLFPVEFPGEGLFGIALTVIAWIVITIVMLILIFLVGNMLWGIIVFMGVMLYWLFYRAYRYVFLKGRACRNRVGLSLAYGGLYTVLYTGWAFILLQIGSWVMQGH
ncbi:small-conductance mechanosensitive channel [Paenibacillus sp. V4I9]|uniref:hypothetical protein n=1 Tax=Paenibacillus sp. V4I9 TaxID=3042308 RepID=UPI00278873A4|nr:hypothetical protein [Paenibacillus sp. V4I9]MDQ0888622.1 small-conductance mechanosensitive channel [Paenibacillus sp. V4I9]